MIAFEEGGRISWSGGPAACAGREPQGVSGEDAATALLLRPLELAFTCCGLAQPDTRRGRPDKGSARKREQHGTDKRAAMAKRGNANFDLARLQ